MTFGKKKTNGDKTANGERQKKKGEKGGKGGREKKNKREKDASASRLSELLLAECQL